MYTPSLIEVLFFSYRGVNCVQLFNLPAHMILDFASLLLSAAAVDREEKKVLTNISYYSACWNKF